MKNLVKTMIPFTQRCLQKQTDKLELKTGA